MDSCIYWALELRSFWRSIVYASRIRAGSRMRLQTCFFFIAVGVIAGGRLGYVVFYNLNYYIGNPLEVFAIWDGGMSFHGGLLGVLVAIGGYARKTRRVYLSVSDFLAPLIPPGLFFGRIGNFINQELWGRVTDLPWGVMFHTAPGQVRHPSQIYEALLEGLLLFIILWWFSSRVRKPGQISGLFLSRIRDLPNHCGVFQGT